MGRKAELRRLKADLAAANARSNRQRAEIDRLQNLVIELQQNKQPRDGYLVIELQQDKEPRDG